MVIPGLDIAIDVIRGADRPGVDPELAALLRKGSLGLVTNPSAVTPNLEPATDALLQAGARLKALFGPEHGVRGDAPDGAPVPNAVDARTGAPMYSLYGERDRPTPEMLAGLDALLFDVQDVGARFYTFSSTLSLVIAAATEAGVPVVILDRPNPIGGAVEGPLLEPEHASFVGMHPVPVRHGATMGELGRLWANCGAGDEPHVVACSDWSRDRGWTGSGLFWVPPSPNIPTVETALVYPGTCLLEGTNVSEGRGTACPFLWLGAPWVDAEGLAEALEEQGLPGVRFRPVRFRPTASKHAGETCSGCHIHVFAPTGLLPVATGYAILATLRRLYPDQFAWREVDGRYPVDRLAGTSRLREAVDSGKDWREIAGEWTAGETAHRERLGRVSLYP